MQKNSQVKYFQSHFPNKKTRTQFLGNCKYRWRENFLLETYEISHLKHTQFLPLNFSPVEKLLCHCGTIVNFLSILTPISETNNQNNMLLSLYKFICMSNPIQQYHSSSQQKLFRYDSEQYCGCHYRIPGLIFQRHKLQHS